MTTDVLRSGGWSERLANNMGYINCVWNTTPNVQKIHPSHIIFMSIACAQNTQSKMDKLSPDGCCKSDRGE